MLRSLQAASSGCYVPKLHESTQACSPAAGWHQKPWCMQAAQSGAQQQQAPVAGPPPPNHLKRQIIKKQHFLEQLERSSQAALAAKHTVTTKRKGARRAAKPLPDLSSLDDILRQVQEAPAKPAAGKKAGSRGRTEQVSSTKARRLIT